MKALITGSRGFVGKHLRAELATHGYTVRGIDLTEDEETLQIDISNKEAVQGCIKSENPDVIFHLAGQPSVYISWKNPQKTFFINVIGTINLLESVRNLGKPCRVILIGSAEQYGIITTDMPVSEETELLPHNPYASSKKAQEDLALIYVKTYGMDICMTRSFNHSGPGQKPGFLISDLSLGISSVERGLAPHLKVGNTEAVRDFTDVRDVAAAYRLICERGTAGEAYNVGSGVGYKVQDILEMMLAMANCEISVFSDADRVRPSDIPVLICDNSKISKLGWKPTISIKRTFRDTLEYYRSYKE